MNLAFDSVAKHSGGGWDFGGFSSPTEWLTLARLWRDLTSGRQTVVASFFADEQCHLLVTSRRRAAPRSFELTPRNRRILERMLLGTGQKALGIDFGLSASMVALILRQCLEFMGLSCLPSRVPPLLVKAACAAEHPSLALEARASRIAFEGTYNVLVSADRPDARLARLLSPAQYAVTRLVVEGKSHADIAAERRASLRTVANQLGAVFRRLRVSGRSELLARLVLSAEPAYDPSARSSDAAPPSLVEFGCVAHQAR
jgi:DNA-binding CsgD family transcriptional regulator